MRAAVLLALAASALAYQVTFPTATEGWSAEGSNKLTWDMVSTDAVNFTVFLTNEDRSVMPINNLELAALVVGSDGNTTLNPPSAGWPKGGGFRVNLCRDPQSPNTILAQSNQFNITSSTSTSATSSGSKTLNTHTGTTFVATGTSGSVDSSSTSTDNLSPVSTSNAAIPGVVAQGGLMGALAVIGALLA